MRRFERKYKEFKLFWEIEAVGATLRERSGEIGEDASFKSIAFANPAYARAAVERDIAQHLANKWREIELPDAVPAPEVVLPKARLQWPPDWAVHVVPVRREGEKRRKLAPDAARRDRVLAHWKQIAPLVKAGVKEIRQRRENAKDDRFVKPEEQQALVDAMPGGLDDLSPRLACVLLRLFEWEPEEQENLVEWWARTKGLAATVEAITALGAWIPGACEEKGARWLGPQRTDETLAWQIVQRASVDAPDADWTRAIAAAKKSLGPNAHDRGDVFAKVFAGVPFFFDKVREDEPSEALACARTLDQAEAAVNRLIEASELHMGAEALVPVVDAVGAAMAPVLGKLLRHYVPAGLSYPELVQDVVISLAALGTKEAYRELLLALGAKELRALAIRCYSSRAVGIEVLAQAAHAGDRDAKTALGTLAREHAAAARAALPSVDRAARPLLEAALAAVRVVEVKDGHTRRFESGEGTKRRFWEIVLDDTTVTVRDGRVGAAGKDREKVMKTAAGARKAYDKLVAAQLDKGFEEVTPAKAKGK